jgi:hypothetical protein
VTFLLAVFYALPHEMSLPGDALSGGQTKVN